MQTQEFNVEEDRLAEAAEIGEIDFNARYGEAMRAHDVTLQSVKQTWKQGDGREKTIPRKAGIR